MCGIVVSTGRGAHARVRVALERLSHRGPDGSGIWTAPDGSTVVGHARLAIFDPTPRSDQPFRRGPLTLAYNGAIYNHLELRAELERVGERFETTSDTEVVAAAMLRWGCRALDRFEGMFALVVHDQRDGSLLAARDRFGIKPLYMTTDGSSTTFASELRALSTTAEVDGQAVAEFLRFGNPITRPIDPTVSELTPGAVLRLSGTSVRVDSFATATRSNPDDPVAALRASIGDHARADRPLAVFLSGGFDSALVLAGLREAGHRPLALTLDTGLNGEDVERARGAARNYGVDHEIVAVDQILLGDRLADFVAAMDQPGIDGFNTALISEACRSADAVVALTGLGGDEMLGGYRYYRLDARLRRALPSLAKLPASARDRSVAPLARVLGVSSVRLRELINAHGVAARHRAFRSLFSPSETRALTGRDAPTTPRWQVSPEETGRRQLAQLDAATYLGPTLLRDADVHSMAHGIELRVPFVDRRVRDAVFASEAPPDKRAIADAWGDRFLARKAEEPKLTFRLPWEIWLDRIIDAHREVLEAPDPWCGLLDADVAGAHLRRGVEDEPLRPWALVCLAAWLDSRSADSASQGAARAEAVSS